MKKTFKFLFGIIICIILFFIGFYISSIIFPNVKLHEDSNTINQLETIPGGPNSSNLEDTLEEEIPDEMDDIDGDEKEKKSQLTLINYINFIKDGNLIKSDSLLKDFYKGNSKDYSEMEDEIKYFKAMNPIFQKISYDIIEINEKNNTSLIKIKIKSIPLDEFELELDKILMDSDINSEEDRIAKILDFSRKISNKNDLKYTENIIEVSLVKIDGQWYIDGNDKLLFNTLTGY